MNTKESNRARFAAKLAEAFAVVKPAFLAAEKLRARALAERQTKEWGERLAAGPPPRRDYRLCSPGDLVRRAWPKQWEKGEWDLRYALERKEPDAVNLDDEADRKRIDWDNPLRERMQKLSYRQAADPEKWQLARDLFAAGHYVPDYRKAEKMATDYVETAEAEFVAKQSRKMENACGNRKVAGLTGELSLSGIVTGFFVVTAEGGDSFRVDMDIITNYRYGHNSANGQLTVYAQYPARFRLVNVGGVQVKKSAGEKWMADNFAR